MMAIDINAYLQRISYLKPLRVDLPTLRSLHRQHLLTVPFENLDIHQNTRIMLDLENLEQKIVFNKRGGFCYELNGLFGALLRQIGFDVTLISAGVYNSRGICGPEFDHLALIVDLEKEWLVDVGYGNSFVEPLLLEIETLQNDITGIYRIDLLENFFQLNSSENGEDFSPKYRFTKQRRQFSDFEEMCNFHQTSPESIFTKNRVCTLATNMGRKTLSGMEYAITQGPHKSKIQLKDDGHFKRILANEFRVVL
jgi:N-hydroxyarylamine O-acetyltransferase